MEFKSLDEQRAAAAAAAAAEAAEAPPPQAHAEPESVPTTDTLPDPAAEAQRRFEEHNLLRATELLQTSQGGFAPSPILRLNAIRISGESGLRPSFLASLCRPYVDPTFAASRVNRLLYGGRLEHPAPLQATTLSSILGLASSLAADLDGLDVLSSIDASLLPTPAGGAEDVDILLAVKPRGRVLLKTSTDVGNGEGSACVQAQLRNLFGGAERLSGSATFGTRTRHAFNLDLSVPLAAVASASLSAYAVQRDLSAWASGTEHSQGFSATLQATLGSVTHQLAYQAALRSIEHLAIDASLALRQAASRPSLKSALSHTATHTHPASGTTTRVTTTLAGLGGDVRFSKLEASSRLPLGPATSLALRAGLIHGTDTHLLDRFQLGGPTDLRMFRIHGLGPREKNDALGGTAYWAAGLSHFTPIRDWPLATHVFLNAGQNAQNHSELKQPSISSGLGLVYTQGPLRVELNAGLPLVARKSDAVRKGLQLGIGIDFL